MLMCHRYAVWVRDIDVWQVCCMSDRCWCVTGMLYVVWVTNVDVCVTGIDLTDPAVREFCKKLAETQAAGISLDSLNLVSITHLTHTLVSINLVSHALVSIKLVSITLSNWYLSLTWLTLCYQWICSLSLSITHHTHALDFINLVSNTHLTHALVSMNLLSITPLTHAIHHSSHTRYLSHIPHTLRRHVTLILDVYGSYMRVVYVNRTCVSHVFVRVSYVYRICSWVCRTHA